MFTPPNFNNVSYIIQGPLDRDVSCVKYNLCQALLWNCEPILSCYDSCNIKEFIDLWPKHIKYIKSQDNYSELLRNNKNQIISTLAGLKNSTKEFSVKIRSDEQYDGLNYLIRMGLEHPDKYTTCNIFFLPGHGPSDHVIFGKTDKLIKGFELSLKNIHSHPQMRYEDYLFNNYLIANNLKPYIPGHLSKELSILYTQCIDIDLMKPYKWCCAGQTYTNSDYLYNNGYNVSMKDLNG